MGARLLLAFVLMPLLASSGAALTFPPASPTPEARCTPLPEPLLFSVRVEPAQPMVGDEVRVTVVATERRGLLVGHASVSLQGGASLFGSDPLPIRHEGLFPGSVTFVLRAEFGGTAELTVLMNYETECACPPVCYFRRTVISPPFTVSALGPTAVPTPQCTPPLCGDDEVFACPDTCPGGCGTICATRTPTPCPTPPCRNDETFHCADACPGGCGATCATRTQTPIPPPDCPGDCDHDGRVVVGELVRGVRLMLIGGDDTPCVVAFDRERSGTLSIDDLIAAVTSALTGCETVPDPLQVACRNSGGVASLESCCAGVGDFRDRCIPGTCGDCSFDLRHAVKICVCGVDRCFDGAGCVPKATRTPTPTLDPAIPTPTRTHSDAILPCLQTGGIDSVRSCCLGAGEYPPTCDIDTCACPPGVSHRVPACDCGAGRCYDTSQGGCVNAGG